MVKSLHMLIVALLSRPVLVADRAEKLSTETMKGAMILGLEEL